jgi:hypothetical protein
MNTTYPLLTIGVLSWNRLHYLRATLESAHRCIHYPNTQWIVLDNVSSEKGLAEYLKRLDWIDDLIFLKSDHVTAMNEIVARTQGEVLLLWPEDVQFIVEGDWMKDCMEIIIANPWIGSMGLACLRRLTLQRHFGVRRFLRVKDWLREIWWFRTAFRCQRRLHSSGGFAVHTYGWASDGIIGSGIPSLTRTEVWKRLGPWKAPGRRGDLIDSSQGGESEMLRRWRRSGWALQRGLTVLPVAADILTDTTGTKAKVRGNIRYGAYLPPSEDSFYYHIYQQNEVMPPASQKIPIPFEEIVKPLGFSLPLDEHGNLRKSAINRAIATTLDEPS